MGISRVVTHVSVLLRKQFLVSSRAWKSTLAQLLLPALFVAALGALQVATESAGPSQPEEIGTKIPACIPPNPSTDCTSVLYMFASHADEVFHAIERGQMEEQCRVEALRDTDGAFDYQYNGYNYNNEEVVCTEDGSVDWEQTMDPSEAQFDMSQCYDAGPEDGGFVCGREIAPIPSAADVALIKEDMRAVMGIVAEQSFGDADAKTVEEYNGSYEDLRLELLDSPNRTQLVIIFYASDRYSFAQVPYDPATTTELFVVSEEEDWTDPLRPFSFIVGYNSSFGFSSSGRTWGTEVSLTATAAISSAMYQHFSSTDEPPSLRLEVAPLPERSEFNAVYYLGGVTFGAALFFNAVFLMYRVALEREQHLRSGMKMVGVSDIAYWVSWAIDALVTLLIATGLIQATGAIFGLRFFTAASGGAVFLVLFTFGLSLIPISLCASMLMPSAKAAMFTAMALTLVSAVFLIIFSTFALELVHVDALDPALPTVRLFLQMLPPFNFQKGLLDIARATPAYVDENAVGLDAYLWENLTMPYEPCDEDFCPAYPSLQDTLLYQVYIFLVTLAITVYTYFVVPSEGGQPLHFFLLPEFWKGVSAAEAIRRGNDDGVAKGFLLKDNWDEDVVRRQKEALAADPTSDDQILLMRGLGKRYGFFNRSREPAVKTMSLAVPAGQVLVVLGRNGSGKSTTLSCITGSISPSWGDIFVCGHSVRYELPEVQKLLGICPQENVQWGELTAREHLEIFARIKGIPASEAAAAATERLEEVDLVEAADRRVGGFSGGMKRRIQLAMAMMGDPRLLLIDECSSGVDPANRRRLWQAIQRFKKGRCVVMTTHQMDEADVLGDEVCIMSDGRMHVIGTPLYLKDKHGSGYRLLLSARTKDKVADVKAKVGSLCPHAKLASTNALQLAFELPVAHVKELVALSAWLETNHNDAKFIVSDFAIEQASLQDVFFRVGEDK
uniref:ABC transporter domain-containing protein n=1 Tax=Sexangularia sp. CB-2014 TaxID=1486929 RepID=A0A6U0IYI5_9EUKA|mmetsp:Transcript_3861/g.12491  ORF Transcript_3861/g.12491 Transcript_3861/m.12491 type:complete len:954 (+) Transcript_3861:32-2893(+)